MSQQRTTLLPLADEPHGQSEKLAKVRATLNASIDKLNRLWSEYDAAAAAAVDADAVTMSDAELADAAKLPALRLRLLRDELALRQQIHDEYLAHRDADRIAQAERLKRAERRTADDVVKKLRAIGYTFPELGEHEAEFVDRIAYHHPAVCDAAGASKEAHARATSQWDTSIALNTAAIDAPKVAIAKSVQATVRGFTAV